MDMSTWIARAAVVVALISVAQVYRLDRPRLKLEVRIGDHTTVDGKPTEQRLCICLRYEEGRKEVKAVTAGVRAPGLDPFKITRQEFEPGEKLPTFLQPGEDVTVSHEVSPLKQRGYLCPGSVAFFEAGGKTYEAPIPLEEIKV